MQRRARIVALAAIPAILVGARPAPAQTSGVATTTTSGPVVSASGQLYAERYFNYGLANQQDVTLNGERPEQLNPNGINYTDCIQDLVLVFSVAISGFYGDQLEAWAGPSDCTADTARGIGQVPTCWKLYAMAGINAATTTTLQIAIHARDIVGYQNSIPNPPTLATLGPEACTAQQQYTAVNLTVYFLPTLSTGYKDPAGTAYPYAIITDLVGPPAPTGVNETVGDTLMNVNWTPNSDSDTAGYDVFIDPIPGQEHNTAAQGEASAPICPDVASPVESSTDSAEAGVDESSVDESSVNESSLDESSVDESSIAESSVDESSVASGVTEASVAESSVDASSDALAEAAPVSNGCTLPLSPGGGSGSSSTCSGVCVSPLLSNNSITIDASASDTTTVDEAGDETTTTTTTNTTTTETGAGGISTIPCQNIVGAGCGTNVTVFDKTVGSALITGLIDNFPYNVAVAATDGSGNIGPPSAIACGCPEPVNDFWKLYREGGGQAGGGFCALEVIGSPAGSTVGLGAAIASLLAMAGRRRRRS